MKASFLLVFISLDCIAEVVPNPQSIAVQGKLAYPHVAQIKPSQDKNREAVEQVNKMLSRFGGREVWQSIRSLHTMEKARDPKHGDGIITSYWRDLEEPAEKGELKHANLSMKYAWNSDGGWINKDGRLREFIDDEVRGKKFAWQHDFFTLLHQLALGSDDYTLAVLRPFGFRVFDRRGEKVADFKLTVDGELYYWHQYGGIHPMTLVFGPTQSFGAIQLPQWVSSSKGDWSYSYVQAITSDKPLRQWVSFTKPDRQWHGGAVNKACPPDG